MGIYEDIENLGGRCKVGGKCRVIIWMLRWLMIQKVKSKVAQSCRTLCNPMDFACQGPSVHGIFPGKDTGAGCHFLLHGIFPTQELNLGLLHCRQTLPSEPPHRSPQKVKVVTIGGETRQRFLHPHGALRKHLEMKTLQIFQAIDWDFEDDKEWCITRLLLFSH